MSDAQTQQEIKALRRELALVRRELASLQERVLRKRAVSGRGGGGAGQVPPDVFIKVFSP